MGHKRILLAVLLVVAAGVGVFVWLSDWPAGPTPGPRDAQKRIRARLYFADPHEACLRAEERWILQGNGPAETGSALVSALIDGPNLDLAPTLPRGAVVKAVAVRNGVAFVDLDRVAVADHPGGSESERLTVYSIVNTVCFNLTGVGAAKILIEGESVTSLKGHMDLRFALKPDKTLIR